MTFECLSPEEIKTWYKEAADPAAMLIVLAELTLSTEVEVAAFLGVKLHNTGKIDNEKAYALYAARKNDQEIAEALGVSRQAVCKWRRSRGLVRAAAEEKRMEAYRLGLSDGKAAAVLGMSKEGYRAWRKKEGLKPNGRKTG